MQLNGLVDKKLPGPASYWFGIILPEVRHFLEYKSSPVKFKYQ